MQRIKRYPSLLHSPARCLPTLLTCPLGSPLASPVALTPLKSLLPRYLTGFHVHALIVKSASSKTPLCSWPPTKSLNSELQVYFLVDSSCMAIQAEAWWTPGIHPCAACSPGCTTGPGGTGCQRGSSSSLASRCIDTQSPEMVASAASQTTSRSCALGAVSDSQREPGCTAGTGRTAEGGLNTCCQCQIPQDHHTCVGVCVGAQRVTLSSSSCQPTMTLQDVTLTKARPCNPPRPRQARTADQIGLYRTRRSETAGRGSALLLAPVKARC